tara:strand:+ start:582 stop:1085 length:504 start_codon:yes stop_codon:yes gene_type:complete
MAASTPKYLMDWRSTMTLIPRDYNTKACGDQGQTFRGPHARVENSLNRVDSCSINSRDVKFASAKPGPTTDTSSRIARLKQLQVRTRTTKIDTNQSEGGTDRGAHPSVQNPTNGADPRSRRAQLFGNYGEAIPGQTSGRNGDSSQVIYFKNVFDRVSLNTTVGGGNN